MTSEDTATQIRKGEELDEAALESYLREQVPDLKGEMQVKQFPGGASNLTYLLTFGQRELVMRRPPFGSKVKSAHDMGREYHILNKLQGHFAQAPKPLAHCEDESVIGAEFYVMERLHGIVLRRNLPDGLSYTPEQARTLCENLLDVQVDLHGVDIEAAGLADFGKPQGYIERQVTGWNKRFVNAHIKDVPHCKRLMQWLEDEMPRDPGRAAVIHNDYKFDNVILDPDEPTKIIGVLDWEMATLGDPVMDLGCSLSYWVQADDPQPMQMIRMLPTHIDGMMTRQELVARYQEKTGLSFDNYEFYYVFGLFRLAVIAQQIYKRYVEGKTQDERFKQFGQFVSVLSGVAEAVIEGAHK